MRDDIASLPLPPAAKRYARMTSKTLGTNWSKKVDMFMDTAAELTHQSKEGFPNKDAAGDVPHAIKEMAERVVARLLEMDFDQEMETIRAAAVRTRQGNVYEAPAHWGAVGQALRNGEKYSDEDLGFVTSTGRFVDRSEAELIGLRANQLRPEITDPNMIHAADFDHFE